jgi:hypothetical protein
MEGILLIAQVGVSLAGGLVMILVAFAFMLLGYVSDEHIERARIYWAEWPLPEKTVVEAAPEKEPRKAA